MGMFSDSVLVVDNPAPEENVGAGVRNMDARYVQIGWSHAFGGIRELYVVVHKQICHEVLHDHGGIPSPRTRKGWLRFRKRTITTRQTNLPGMSP
jgi:hypothetical protein